jgi:hypothetical protein
MLTRFLALTLTITVTEDMAFEENCVFNGGGARLLAGSLTFADAGATTDVTFALTSSYLQQYMLPASGTYSVLACP